MITLSKRLQVCASLIPKGARVADIGADHGHLGIYLLEQNMASFVIATDVREQPLRHAIANAQRSGVTDRMRFLLCNGLEGIHREDADAVVIAGMGGDTISAILSRCPWAETADITWIFQPGSSANDLRRYLSGRGWRIERDLLVDEGRFIYNLIMAHPGGGVPLTPGEQYVSPQMLRENSAELPKYFQRVLRGLEKAVTGIEKAERDNLEERLYYYKTAYREVLEMRDQYGIRMGN